MDETRTIYQQIVYLMTRIFDVKEFFKAFVSKSELLDGTESGTSQIL